jgi:uncharacterized protein
MKDSQYWIETLGLVKHPEGGYFQESYRCPETMNRAEITTEITPVIPPKISHSSAENRNLVSSIYFLLPSNDISRFHRLKSDEIWYYHAGSPLVIFMIDNDGMLKEFKLGLHVEQGEHPQIVVPCGSIFGAAVCQADSFTLMGCVVTPGFDYRDFELIPREMLLKQYPQYQEIIVKLTSA